MEDLTEEIKKIKEDIKYSKSQRNVWETAFKANPSNQKAEDLFITFSKQLAAETEILSSLLKKEQSATGGAGGVGGTAGGRRRAREASETNSIGPITKKSKVDPDFSTKALTNDRVKGFIRIYNSKEFPELLLEVGCWPLARTWGRISSFLEAACVEFDNISNYDLFHWSCALESFTQISLNGTANMEGGTYCVCPKEDRPPLKLVENVYPLIPMSKKSSAAESRNDAETSETSETTVPKQDQSFAQRLMQRDCHCAVTKDFSHLFGCHILAFGWSSRDRWTTLPHEIRGVVGNLEKKIDDIQNGILLDIRISAMFDSGGLSFEYRDNVLYSVAIRPEAKDYDGIRVDQNQMKRSDGCAWWCEKTRPEPQLIKFHFRNSVLSKLTGSAMHNDTGTRDDVLSTLCEARQRLFPIACS